MTKIDDIIDHLVVKGENGTVHKLILRPHQKEYLKYLEANRNIYKGKHILKRRRNGTI